MVDGVISNQLAFKIVEPRGEEKEALRLMEAAFRASTWKERGPSAPIYQQVVERFPESPFAEMCSYLAIAYSHWREAKEGTWDKTILDSMMLENYPNSGHSRDLINAFTWQKEDAEKLAILDELMQKHPNTRCHKFAELMKKRILKGVKD